MQDTCDGPPPAAAGKGGMRQQLMALKAGRHPVTGSWLPASSSSSALGSGTYSRLKPTEESDALFTPYVPIQFDQAIPWEYRLRGNGG